MKRQNSNNTATRKPRLMAKYTAAKALRTATPEALCSEITALPFGQWIPALEELRTFADALPMHNKAAIERRRTACHIVLEVWSLLKPRMDLKCELAEVLDSLLHTWRHNTVDVHDLQKLGALLQDDRLILTAEEDAVVNRALLNTQTVSSENTIQVIRTLVQTASQAVQQARELGPDAAKQRARVRHLQDIATKGGRATARYTNTELTNAFAAFKRRNPGKNAWDAANALIRKGQPLDKFNGVTSAWNRVGRIAEQTLGITREEWFDDL